MRPVAVVVGAGVNGLTCAVRLLEAGARVCEELALPLPARACPSSCPLTGRVSAGWDVHCISRDRPEKTVSLGAGAIWEFPPVCCAATRGTCAHWGRTSHTQVSCLASVQGGAAGGGPAVVRVSRHSPLQLLCLTLPPFRVLATRDVFDALAPAVERTGVCIRRVHYLYRDNGAVPGDVEVGDAPFCLPTPLLCDFDHTCRAHQQRPHWLRAVREYRCVATPG